MIEELKNLRDKYLKKVCNYYRKNNKSPDFKSNIYNKLWDNFMGLSEVIYLFEDYPRLYSIFLEYNKNQTISNYFIYEETYEYYLDLLYNKLCIY